MERLGDLKDMRQHCELQAVASSGGVVTCVAGTCAPAPRLKWSYLSPVSVLYVRARQAWTGFQQMVFFM